MSNVKVPMHHAWLSCGNLGVLEQVAERVQDGKPNVSHGVQLGHRRNSKPNVSHGIQLGHVRNGKPNLSYGVQLEQGHNCKLSLNYGIQSDHGHNGKPKSTSHGVQVEDGENEEPNSNYGVQLEYGHNGKPDAPDSSTSSRDAEHAKAFASLLQNTDPSIEDFVSILNENRKLKNLAYAKTLHVHICEFGLEDDSALGNYLVPMFVGCGSIADAHQVFCKLAHPNEYSWSALAQGYVECGELQHAIDLCQNHQVISSNFMLTALLKACANLKCVEKGKELHIRIVKQGNDGDLFVGNSLVDMYAKFGSLIEAREVFEKLPVQDVVSWTALIAGYVEYGFSEKALNCLDLMQLEAVPPNVVTYVCSLKACSSIGAIDRGREIHTKIVKDSFETDPQVSNTLVDMYAKFALLEEAEKVFNKLPSRDVVAWTALMRGYAEHGVGEAALISLDKMQLEGVSPNAVTFSCILKACRNMRAIDKGYTVHSEIVKEGYDSNIYVGTTLLDMYAECGSLEDALQVFDKLPVRSAVSWNALIAAYSESGLGEESLKCFEQMQLEGMPHDAVTFIFSLRASASTGSIDRGQLIHYEIAKEGFENDPFVGSMLVDLYAKCGFLVEAWEVFEQLPIKDVVSWTAIIGGYAEWGFHERALDRFKHMQLEDVSPNAFTYVSALKACGSIKGIDKGIELHSGIVKQGLEKDVFVHNALVDMYSQCGGLLEAQRVFKIFPNHDVVSWNILIGGYADHGLGNDALNCLDLMQEEGVPANAVTYIFSLKACGSLRDLDRGQEMHAKIVKEEFEGELFVGNSLVDMYAKCGSLAGAQHVFEELPVRDVVSWNTLIAGYVDRGLGAQGLNCLEQMELEGGVFPNAVTYVCSLKACSNIGAIDRGYRFHAKIVQEGFEVDSFVGTTLVCMYASFGIFPEAKEVFYELPVRDVVCWTALMAGYADCGLGEEVLQNLQQMQLEGVPPNVVTFVCSLKACGGVGAKGRAHELHSEIAKRGFDKDTSLAYTLVETYVKYGSLAEARAVFDKLPVQDEGFWAATVAANADHGLGEEVLTSTDQACPKRMSLNAAGICPAFFESL